MVLGQELTWQSAGAPTPPWDYRVKYVESVNANAYFYLAESLPNLTTTPTAFDSSWVDLWELVLGVPTVNTTDKHLLGKSYGFGLAQYNGRWRPSFASEWPSSIPISAYNPVMFRAETGRMRCLTADGNTQIWERTGSVFVRFSADKSTGWGKLLVGVMANDQGNITFSQHRGSSRVYSFRRVCQNVPEFTLIPCVKDGVPGLYDEVSGVFCASTSGTAFVAGPRVNDDGTDLS